MLVEARRPGRAGDASETLVGLQALRAVACLLVVAYHALGTRDRAHGGGAEPWPNGAAGVDLFFVISGYVMAVSARKLAGRRDPWRVFMARRLERIVPLYWLLTLAKAAITLAAPGMAPTTRLSGWNMAASLLFIPARDAAGIVRPVLPVGWTLNFEMLFYLVFAAALALRRPALGVLLAVLVPLGVAGFWRQDDWPAVLSLANGLVLELCAGVALAKLFGRIRRPSPGAAALLLVAGSLALLLAAPAGPWRFLAWGGPALCVVAGTVGLEPWLKPRLPALVLRLGDASYAIYLSHVFLIPVLARGIGHAALAGTFGLATLVAASLVVCPAAGLALHRWVDEPMQTWLRRRRAPPLHCVTT